MKNVFIPSWFDDLDLDPYSFRVLAHIVRCGKCWQSAKVMAIHCKIDRKRVFKSLTNLESKGLVSKQSKHGQTSVYVFKLPVPQTEQVKTELEPEPVPKTEREVTRKRNTHQCRKRNTKDTLIKDTPIKDVLPFDSESFRTIWNDWKQHRKELKKPLTPTSIKRQFKELEKLGETESIRWIEYAIKKGWQGLYQPNDTTKNQPRPINEKLKYQQNGNKQRGYGAND